MCGLRMGGFRRIHAVNWLRYFLIRHSVFDRLIFSSPFTVDNFSFYIVLFHIRDHFSFTKILNVTKNNQKMAWKHYCVFCAVLLYPFFNSLNRFNQIKFLQQSLIPKNVDQALLCGRCNSQLYNVRIFSKYLQWDHNAVQDSRSWILWYWWSLTVSSELQNGLSKIWHRTNHIFRVNKYGLL